MLALLRSPMSSRPQNPSLIYRNPLVYRAAMAVLYGRYYRARTRSVAALVAPGASVLELCCGPGTLYLGYLRAKHVRYRGLDLNPVFVRRLRDLGVDAQVADVSAASLPPADIVLIQASLYHFITDARTLIDRMRDAARQVVIVSEPVRNLATSQRPFVARLAARSTSPGDRQHANRFTEASLDALMASYGDAVRDRRLICGGRDKIYVLRGSAEAGS
jgi:SAM-dependent methyltransferase